MEVVEFGTCDVISGRLENFRELIFPVLLSEGRPLESEHNGAKRFTAGRYRAGLTPS